MCIWEVSGRTKLCNKNGLNGNFLFTQVEELRGEDLVLWLTMVSLYNNFIDLRYAFQNLGFSHAPLMS